MTRDELMERLAAEMHARETDGESNERTCETCQALVAIDMRDYWPPIVDFVAAWIAEVHDMHDDALAERWREEMGS